MLVDLLIPLLVGLAIFLFGMKVMELAMQFWAGPYLERFLRAFTRTPLRGMISGAGITALFQSSTAVTVITIGLVNAGVLTFPRTLGIILGTNIGTCMTTELIGLNLNHLAVPLLIAAGGMWILSWIVPEERAAPLERKGPMERVGPVEKAILGERAVPVNTVGPMAMPVPMLRRVPMKTQKALRALLRGVRALRYVSLAVCGFACILIGMEVMQSIVPVLRSRGLFALFLEYAQRSLLWGVLAGAMLTAVIQSSAAAVAMTMALSSLDIIDLDLGIAVVMGANIGTCLTAVIAAVGGSKAAQFVAWSHVALNVGGTLLLFPFIPALQAAAEWMSDQPAAQVARAQTLFNVVCSLAALPLCYLPVFRKDTVQ
jgi:Na+/phosphate symporter